MVRVEREISICIYSIVFCGKRNWSLHRIFRIVSILSQEEKIYY